jgi:predicted PhzF superfamily epimerase YddE/YHI9
MTATNTPTLGQIHALLAERGYEVSEAAADTLKIRELSSGITVQAVLQGEIMFFSLTCTTVPQSAITPELMARMLEADNGIHTSHFQLYDAGNGQVAITLANFCKLQEMGPDDEDDILSCVHFLLVDVMTARHLLSDLVS